jgi:hypothetical protein
MKTFRSLVSLSLVLSAGMLGTACTSFSTDVSGAGGAGADVGAGGADATAGTTGAGGAVGRGGTPGAAGASATGAAGTTGAGGTIGEGGSIGTGSAGSGDVAGAGGAVATGGSGGKGGSAGSSSRGGTTGGGTAGTAGGAGATGSAGTTGAAGATSAGGAGGGETPCAILAAAGNACVAAHSTVRVLYPGYAGPLYQVCKGSFAAGQSSCKSGMTKDIGSVAGYADAAAQDAFCAGGSCTISIIYDQTPMANDLRPAPAGGAKNSSDNPVVATDLKTTLNGHAAYGVYIKPGTGYRSGCKTCTVVTPKGTATGDQPETQYMVTSQNGLVNGCCFDYGNAETSNNDDGNGTMEAIYFGGGVVWGTGSPGGHNNGPWVMADLENGLYAGWENNQDQNISTNTPLKYNFVTAVVIGDTADKNGGKGRFALYGGNAQSGTVKTLYDGIRPAKNGYVPMHKQGSIILGIGGDNSAGAGGQWFEGVMASGAATVATANALQANIVAAGYGK